MCQVVSHPPVCQAAAAEAAAALAVAVVTVVARSRDHVETPVFRQNESIRIMSIKCYAACKT